MTRTKDDLPRLGSRALAVLALLASGCGGNGSGMSDDGGTDSGTPDARPSDTAPPSDAGSLDGGTSDAGTGDAGPADGGSQDAEAPDAGGAVVECSALDDAITADGLRGHLEALQGIADDNGGTRSVATSGWEASVDYVVSELEAVGHTVSTPTFDYPFFEELGDPALERTAPTAETYAHSEDGTTGDFQSVFRSPPGDVTADVTPVDLDLGADNTSSSGCEAEDFTDFPTGHLALVQRGACPFVAKVLNAQAAGATGVILFNQGNTADREGLLPDGVALLAAEPDHGITIPVVFARYGVGEAMATTIGGGDTVTVHLTVDTVFEVRSSENVIVDVAGADEGEVIVFGGHLDSVPEGPGINDNGSGVSALLEIAAALTHCDLERSVRFAWWGSEENGMWGSKSYVGGLSDEELASIHSYINADILGSTNHVYFVYDGDGSAFDIPGPPGSGDIERFFASDLLFAGLSSDEIFGDRSDHVPFVLAGVPYGGLFTGVDMAKTDAQAETFGGTAGEPLDPCYHSACDTIDNVDMHVLEEMADSLARGAQFYGVEGRSVPPSP